MESMVQLAARAAEPNAAAAAAQAWAAAGGMDEVGRPSEPCSSEPSGPGPMLGAAWHGCLAAAVGRGSWSLLAPALEIPGLDQETRLVVDSKTERS